MINFLLILFTILQVADLATTVYGLSHGDVERNPLLATIFAKFGVLEPMVIAKAVAVFVAWEYVRMEAALIVVNLIYIGIIFNNVKTLRSQ
jgi:Domain of unknown function (DUF5658)